MDYQYLKNIKPGMKVVVLSTRKKYVTGIVEEIAARTLFHEEGVMVRLTNGDVGRVKKIIIDAPGQNEKNTLEIKKMIEGGENYHTEFKAHAFWSVDYSLEQIKESKSVELRDYGRRASKIIIAKSLAAMLNSDGGNLIIGIREEKEKEAFIIEGVEEDMHKLKQHSVDQYKRVFIDEIIRAFFPPKLYNHLHDYLAIIFVAMEEKTVCWLKIKKSDLKIFLKINNKEVFMIRVDSENRTLEGEKLVDYCIKRWGGR